MSRERMNEPLSQRWLQRMAGLGRETGSEILWRLELLGLVNGWIFLGALGAFVLSFPLEPTPLRLGALSVVVVCIGFGLWRRRPRRTSKAVGR